MPQPNVVNKLLPYFLVVMIATVCLTLAATATRAATREQSEQLISWLGEQAIDTLSDRQLSLEDRERAFRTLLHKAFALKYIGRFVLGRGWRAATAEQRAEYLELFGEFMVKTYSQRLGGYAGETFTVIGARKFGKKGDVIVKTRIGRPSGPPLDAGWRVREIDGSHKIIDVQIEGVSMAVTQRQDFAAVTRKRGVEGLLQILRTRTERLTTVVEK